MKVQNLILALVATAFSAVACQQVTVESSAQTTETTVQVTEPTTIENTYSTANDLKPDTSPPKHASMLLTGIEIDAVLQEERNGNAIVYRWVKPEDQDTFSLVEEEKYFLQNSVFSLASGPAESFEPAVPLLKFPFKVGDAYTWEGVQHLGRQTYPATAKITTTSEFLNLPTGNFEAVLVQVDLHVELGSPGGSNTTFKFWFKPNEGLVKREFGISSSREPREGSQQETPE